MRNQQLPEASEFAVGMGLTCGWNGDYDAYTVRKASPSRKTIWCSRDVPLRASWPLQEGNLATLYRTDTGQAIDRTDPNLVIDRAQDQAFLKVDEHESTWTKFTWNARFGYYRPVGRVGRAALGGCRHDRNPSM